MSLFRNAEKFQTRKLWWTIGKFEETKGRSTLIRFEEEIGELFWKKFMAEEQEF